MDAYAKTVERVVKSNWGMQDMESLGVLDAAKDALTKAGHLTKGEDHSIVISEIDNSEWDWLVIASAAPGSLPDRDRPEERQAMVEQGNWVTVEMPLPPETILLILSRAGDDELQVLADAVRARRANSE